jgi:hypothetical protein
MDTVVLSQTMTPSCVHVPINATQSINVVVGFLNDSIAFDIMSIFLLKVYATEIIFVAIILLAAVPKYHQHRWVLTRTVRTISLASVPMIVF